MNRVSRAMIDKIIILSDAGIPLYEWSSSRKPEDSSLLSGFLAALSNYAKHDRGEEITKITLDPTTFIFRRENDLIFTVLTKDPELEKVIVLILDAVKEKFLREFGEKTRRFTGASDRFQSFDRTLHEILDDYGYLDYEDAKSSSASEQSYNSFLIFQGQTGEPLYVNAKEYIPRKPLGFQVPIVIRAAQRVISMEPAEKLSDISIVSTKMRCLSLRSTPFVQVVKESVLGGATQAKLIEPSEKLIKRIIKKPDQLFLEINDPFIVFDESGGILLTNDRAHTIDKLVVPADCIAVWQSSKNIFSDVYKESAWASFLLSTGKMYAVFGIDKYVVFARYGGVAKLDTYQAMNKVSAFCRSLRQ